MHGRTARTGCRRSPQSAGFVPELQVLSLHFVPGRAGGRAASVGVANVAARARGAIVPAVLRVRRRRRAAAGDEAARAERRRRPGSWSVPADLTAGAAVLVICLHVHAGAAALHLARAAGRGPVRGWLGAARDENRGAESAARAKREALRASIFDSLWGTRELYEARAGEPKRALRGVHLDRQGALHSELPKCGGYRTQPTRKAKPVFNPRRGGSLGFHPAFWPSGRGHIPGGETVVGRTTCLTPAVNNQREPFRGASQLSETHCDG